MLSGFIVALIVVTLEPDSHAQVPDPTRLGEGIRPLSVPGLEEDDGIATFALEDQNDFAPESPGDDDLGQQLILRSSERERWFNAQFNSSLFTTDNAANLSTGEKADTFWANQLSLGAQPKLRDRLYLDAFVSQQIYRYHEYDFLDYEYLQASLGLIRLEPQLWDSILYIQGQYGRTTSDSFGQDVLNSFSLVAGIQKTIVFDRKNSLYMNLMGDWDLATDVDSLANSQYILDLSYRYKIMRDLVLSASYRFTWFDYQNVDRSDVLNLAGVYLSWTPEKWISLYVGTTLNFNNSNVDVFDYHSASVGGGLGLLIRF